MDRPCNTNTNIHTNTHIHTNTNANTTTNNNESGLEIEEVIFRKLM